MSEKEDLEKWKESDIPVAQFQNYRDVRKKLYPDEDSLNPKPKSTGSKRGRPAKGSSAKESETTAGEKAESKPTEPKPETKSPAPAEPKAETGTQEQAKSNLNLIKSGEKTFRPGNLNPQA